MWAPIIELGKCKLGIGKRSRGNPVSVSSLMSRFSLVWILLPVLAANAGGAEPVTKPYGIEQRELWTTGNLHGSPEPPDPYRTEDAFPKLKFMEPLSVGLVPGQNRFAVATRPGRIHTFEIRPDVERTSMLLELNRTVYGVAFHPRVCRERLFLRHVAHRTPSRRSAADCRGFA